MKTKLFFTALFFSMMALNATAQSANRSLKDENRRIRQGVVSGQLTAAETARLKAAEARLKAEALRYKTNDGKIGPRERADLRRDEKRLDRKICQQKHDTQRRH
ncbi:MAG: hypothetical protein WCJ85_09015 [Chitinophagaceae bacterium]